MGEADTAEYVGSRISLGPCTVLQRGPAPARAAPRQAVESLVVGRLEEK
jgi:hypothetical protein